MKLNETKIHKMLIENADLMLHNLSVVASEFTLKPAMDLLRREVVEDGVSCGTIGKIDVILRYKRKIYITEIKYAKPTNTSSDFWESLKVLGYAKYYSWQTGQKVGIYPAVMVPLHSIKLEQQIIAGQLGLAIFATYQEDEKVKIKLLDDRPIWQQKIKKQKTKDLTGI